jgi:pimeloyl-ACP methyl ester carboxylesterase
MIARFREREPFVRWTPEALGDYCEFGILPRDGTFMLACLPEIEASIYHASKAPESNIYPEIERIRQPVTVLRAGKIRPPDVFDLSASPTAPDLAGHFSQGREVLLPALSHYIPMEAPDRLKEQIRRLL